MGPMFLHFQAASEQIASRSGSPMYMLRLDDLALSSSKGKRLLTWSWASL